MSVQGNIILSEGVKNKLHKFGETSKYFPCYIVEDDIRHPALFTEGQIKTAIERASNNVEDFDKRPMTFWEMLFG